MKRNDNTEKEISPCTKFGKKAMPGLLQLVKLANELPLDGTPAYTYYNAFPPYKDIINGQSTRLLHLIQKLVDAQEGQGNLLDVPVVKSIDQKFACLVDINDRLMERVNDAMECVENPKRRDNPSADASLVLVTAEPVSQRRRSLPLSWLSQKVVSQPVDSATKPAAGKEGGVVRLYAGCNIPRPQVHFTRQPDNSADTPFTCLLKEKPNALKSLQESLLVDENDYGSGKFLYPHPYQYELDLFTPTQEQMNFGGEAALQLSPPIEMTPLVMVMGEGTLRECIDQLKQQTEIAVDLEHHDYRTYLGLTCLVQISTRTTDYIIDALVLRDHLHLLNEVFTDPRIVKVLHGADWDVMWLQRDCGVYLVNLFDTGLAARALQLGRYSLSYLLEAYCQLTIDKRFQRAEWRIRPLPSEMIEYARTDTHYLLYLFDRMRLELTAKGLSEVVWERGRQLCLKRYEKPQVCPTDYLGLYNDRAAVNLDARQWYAVQHLYLLRDRIARQEDESISYVLPNHMLKVIAEVLPREYTGIFACCNPVPPLVRKYVYDLHKIVLEARKQTVKLLESGAASLTPGLAILSVDPSSCCTQPLVCPHDLSHCTEYTGSGAMLEDHVQPVKLVGRRGANLKLAAAISQFVPTDGTVEDCISLAQRYLKQLVKWIRLEPVPVSVPAADATTSPHQLGDELTSSAEVMHPPADLSCRDEAATSDPPNCDEDGEICDSAASAPHDNGAEPEGSAKPARSKGPQYVQARSDPRPQQQRRKMKTQRRQQSGASDKHQPPVEPFDYAAAKQSLFSKPNTSVEQAPGAADTRRGAVQNTYDPDASLESTKPKGKKRTIPGGARSDTFHRRPAGESVKKSKNS